MIFRPKPIWQEYGIAVGVLVIATLICFAMMGSLELTNLVMVYLLGTLLVSARGRRGPAAFACGLSVLCFDFFFVPPRFTFTVSDAQYVFTFVVMFITAMSISHLTIRLREEAEAAREGEQRTAWLMEKAKKAEIEVETEQLRSSLLSTVSHDFRTPLAAILGSATTLLATETIQGNPTARPLLENIQAEGERLSHLVQNILEATRLESATPQLRKERYPLEEVVGSAIEQLEREVGARTIEVQIPEDFPLVPMDALLIGQLLINLLSNAVRHSGESAPIELSATVVNQMVKISIADHGAGIPETDLERVFEKFYRGPLSHGAGLGLAICKAIVKVHGGEISAENRKPHGAIFTFTLPLEDTYGH